MPAWWVLITAARTLGIPYTELADSPHASYLVGIAAEYQQLRAEMQEAEYARMG